ncbi:ATP-dependent nuclease [Falsiruegeria mediterranea]
MRVNSVDFFDYKSFPRFSISAKRKNVLVGPNNTGKSTTLDAFRIAFDALRYASRRSALLKTQGEDGVCSTYRVPQSVIQTDLRYCVHNFGEGSATIRMKRENGNQFVVKISPDADLECFLVSDVEPLKSAKFLRNQFPNDIVVVPTLSPLEQNEPLVRYETVEANRFSRLASRNFRNFWLHRTEEEFNAFADLVEAGWPGLRILPPEIEAGDGRRTVRMYFRDGPHVREVQWAGFGFQVWMQTMMHLCQANHNSILVLDEPDIYLHPDLQHRLLRVVSQRVGQYFIATHSTEIINDVDPGDVLILRPGSRSAKRIRNEEGYSEVFVAIGSSENAQFARLARTKSVLYFEGKDNRLLGKLAKEKGGIDYLANSSVTIMKTDGFSNWARVSTTSWVFNNFFEFNVTVAAIFDRDYRCDAEVEEFKQNMAKTDVLCHVLPFKELENILLVPTAIARVVEKFASKDLPGDLDGAVHEIVEASFEAVRDETLAKRVGKKIEFDLSKNPKKDIPTISAEETKEFKDNWSNVNFRQSVVPGKAVFSDVVGSIQENFGVTVTASRVIDALDVTEIDQQVFEILVSLRDYFSPSS